MGKIYQLFSKTISNIGIAIAVILSIFIVLFLIWHYAIYPLYYYLSDGNFFKAIIVIFVLSISIYLLIILIVSLTVLKDWSGRLNVPAKIVKKRKLYVLIFRSALLIISLWCLFAARDLTVLLYQDQDFSFVNFLYASNIFDTDTEFFDVISGTLFLGIIVAIILIIFSINIVENKPFLKIVRFWNWLHYLHE